MAVKSLKNHPILASLMRLQELLDNEAFQSAEIASDESALFNREKLQSLTKSLRSLVNQTAATLVSDTALNQMNTNLQTVISELTLFTSNNNIGHLTNAVAQFDQNVLSLTWAFLPKVNPPSKVELGDIVDSLLERSRQTIEQLNTEKEALASNISELINTIQAQELRLAEVNNAQNQLKIDMNSTLSNLETAFNKAQLERDNDFASVINNTKKNLENASTTFNQKAASVIKSLEDHKSDAARIVQVVGDIGVTGNYQKIANDETSAANTWRRITVGLFSFGLLIAAFTFWKFYHEPITATNTLAIAVRLLYALAVAAPAFYTARESARHRTNADRARQTELELASLGPFIELMDDEDKEEIRKSLIPTYFGRPVDAHEIKPVFDVSSKS